MFEALMHTADPSGKYSALYGLMNALYGRPVKEGEHYGDYHDSEMLDYINSGD